MPSQSPEKKQTRDLSSEKTLAEIRKLELEAKKIESDNLRAPTAFRFEQWKSIGTMLTALAALAGLFLTLRSQQLSAENEALRRENDQYLAAVRQYGENSETARLAAVTSLEQYLSIESSLYRQRTAQLFASALEVETSDAVRSQISRSLASNPSPSIVSTLRQRNLQLQEELMDSASLLPEDLPFWERSDSDNEKVQHVAEKIENNGRAIVSVINGMFRKEGVVRDLDLSKVMISMPVVSELSEHGFAWRPRLSLAFSPGIRFDGVDFTESKLSWLELEDCEITRAKLDRARLVKTKFIRCKLSGGTSAADFIGGFRLRNRMYPEYGQYSGPQFIRSEVDLVSLYPANIDIEYRSDASVFLLRDSSWKIGKPGPEIRKRYRAKVLSKLTGDLFEGSGSYQAVPIPLHMQDWKHLPG